MTLDLMRLIQLLGCILVASMKSVGEIASEIWPIKGQGQIFQKCAKTG